MYRFLLLPLLFSFQVTSQELTPVPMLGSGEAYGFHEISLLNSRYQIGDEWGKVPVTEEVMAKSRAIYRASAATARVGGATGFILGEFDGQLLVGTNNHVCPSAGSCRSGKSISFPALNNLQARIKNFVGSYPEIDFALFTIDVSGPQKAKLMAVASNFDFSGELPVGLPLVTAGFGTADNWAREMVVNFDGDCRVISGSNEFRKMKDPDALNPGRHEVWSFANGCDVSHGDSGSAMVNALNGKPVGIIWTGKIPKNKKAQYSKNIQDWQQNQSPEVWTELSYAVPAKKIYDVLGQKQRRGKIPEPFTKLMDEFLGL